MDKYDRKQMGDRKGSSHGSNKVGNRVKARVSSGAPVSTGERYFPEKPMHHSFSQIDEIGEFNYPDTTDSIIREQQGNVKMARKDEIKTMYRK